MHEIVVTPPVEDLRSSTNRPISEAELDPAENGNLIENVVPENPPPQQQQESSKWRRQRGDTSKRRKGVYITQWPEPVNGDRKKLSSQSSEEYEEPVTATPSDLSDGETQPPKTYVVKFF